MLRLFNVTRRMAVIEMTGKASITLTRSRKDGSTVGVKSSGFYTWKTLDVEELLDALAWVTMSDDQLLEQGMPEDKVKVKRPKRARKPKRDDDEENPFF